jgi:hypothetical protein
MWLDQIRFSADPLRDAAFEQRPEQAAEAFAILSGAYLSL